MILDMRSLLTLILLWPVVSYGQVGSEHFESSGNAFLRTCSVIEKEHSLTAGDVMQQEACAAYVSGFVEGLSFATEGAETSSPIYCPPSEGPEAGQLVRIVLKYIRDHPETAHQRTYLLAGRALRGSFPCK